MMHEETAAQTGRPRYLLFGGAIILGLLIGLGIGVMVTGEAEAEAEVDLPTAVQQTHLDWYEAWNQADGQGVVSMMAPTGRHYCPATGNKGASGDELADLVSKGLVISDIELTGVLTLDTPGTSSGTSSDHIVVTTLSVDGHPGYVSVLHLRGPDDDLDVLSHRSFR